MGELIKIGWVRIKGKNKVFQHYRRILRGENAGRIEVQIKEINHDGPGWEWVLRSRIVDESAVTQWPERKAQEDVKTRFTAIIKQSSL